MKAIQLRNHFQNHSTIVRNDFIDNYMIKANGEYVKVYLFLLRYLQDPCMSLSLSTIADCLENTEKDVIRALTHWEQEGLLSLEYDADQTICGIDMGEALLTASNNVVVEELPVHKADFVEQSSTDISKDRKELKSLLFIAEQYLGKTLSAKDIETITYFYDTLHFSADLIEYLIEYCVENGHKSMHYIQKVALSWHDSNIRTVDQAKDNSSLYHKNCYSILNAFGIKGRAPAVPELAYIQRWTNEYGFTLDIILEACNRTMAKLHQPNFEYTDSILKKWKASRVHHLSDLKQLDQAHRQAATSKKPEQKAPTKNKFNNFEGRQYDYDSLEKQLLGH